MSSWPRTPARSSASWPSTSCPGSSTTTRSPGCSPSSSMPGRAGRGVGHDLMAAADGIARDAGAAFIEVTAGSSSAGGSSPVRGDGLRRDGDRLPAEATLTEAGAEPRFPHLRLRTAPPGLLELPWELPLADWPAAAIDFRELQVGPSRHLVRFVADGGVTLRAEGGAARDRPARVRGAPPARGGRTAGGHPDRAGRGTGAVRGDPGHDVPGPLAPVPPPADASPVGLDDRP